MASTTGTPQGDVEQLYTNLLSSYDDLLDDLFAVFDQLAFSAFGLSEKGDKAFEKICDVKQVIEGVRGFLPDELPAKVFTP